MEYGAKHERRIFALVEVVLNLGSYQSRFKKWFEMTIKICGRTIDMTCVVLYNQI
jgi:hypothetical protein